MYDDYYDDEEEEEEVSAPAIIPQNQPPVEEGKIINAFSKAFFVLTIIGTVLAAITVFLPFFLIIIGIFSVLFWFIAIVFVTVFTLGIIWTFDETKAINAAWMGFNGNLFNSSATVAGFAESVIPFILISGAIVISLAWLFTIIGVCATQSQRKKYVGRIVGLIIITVLYIVFLVINILLISKQIPFIQ